MGSKTGIEWTDATWNPIIGCSRVSEGCRNCYAEGIAGRFGNGKPTVYSGLTQIVNGRAVWTGKIAETKQLEQPLSWRKPKRVFVNSMSDLFHENVTDAQRDKIFAVMALCPQHTFQVLTKRPDRMLDYLVADGAWHRIKIASEGISRERCLSIDWSAHRSPEFLAHVWLGVSVENQAAANERIPLLLETPAAKRFISAEPLLGRVSLRNIPHSEKTFVSMWDALTGFRGHMGGGSENNPKIDWVICGGESGPHARPMHPDWARSLRDQCAAAGVPFFFKQFGEYAPIDSPINNSKDVVRGARQCVKIDGQHCDTIFMDGVPEGAQWMERVGKKAAGALLDGVEHKAFPEGK